MNVALETYLKRDRQWFREHRIAHAQFQLRRSTNPEEKRFWRAVLQANGFYDKEVRAGG